MLEVCFSDSVKGSLAIAQNCNNIRFSAGAAFFSSRGLFASLAKRKALRDFQNWKRELQKKAVPLGGKREDIVSIPLGLSEGDIAAPIIHDDCPRKNHLYALFSFYLFAFGKDAEDANSEETFRADWDRCMADLERLKTCPDKIRIWLDRTPDAQCGLLFIAHLLKDSGTEIHIVELPEKIQQSDNCVISYSGWGDVEPELFGTFLDRERTLTHSEIQALSQRWEELQAENAPLRIFENGTIRGVDESYYDNQIRQEFPKDSCKVAIIIGNALGRQQIPTGDAFIAKRIQQFICSGELIVVESYKDRFYSTVVRCSQQKY